MRIEPLVALDLATEVLVGAGVRRGPAAQQADVLVDAECRRVPSHGLLRLPRLVRRIASGALDPRARGRQHWSSPTFLEVDGEQGLGPPVALSALEAVLPAALEHGVACAAVTNANHLGMIGFYARRVAEQGLVCLAMTSSEPLVHPWGGTRAMVGTNPLAIAVPSAPHPLVLDMATSTVSMGKVHDHARRGLPLEPGWALDAEGRETTDAASAVHGSVAPFGGAKGYGLGVSLGALLSFVTGSAPDVDVRGTLDDVHPSSKGDLFVLLRGAQRPVEGFLDQVRASPAADPRRPVAVPGDGAARRHRLAQADGLHIDDGLWAELEALLPTGRHQRDDASGPATRGDEPG